MNGLSEPSARAVLDTLADLIRINSVNPNYEGGVSEAALADYVERFFSRRGIETERQSVLPNRPNLLAKIEGRDSRRRILFEAHLDTVSTAAMAIEPWDPEIRDGKMYGRGSCDTKGGMAAMMHAAASLVDEGIQPPCDVIFAATCDEEYSYRGATALCNSLDPTVPQSTLPALLSPRARAVTLELPSSDPNTEDQAAESSSCAAGGSGLTAQAAVVAEPTGLRAAIAGKGVVRWTIETRGKSAHSSKPQLGNNAIEQMAHVINALKKDTDQRCKHPHPLLGPATCNVGVIRGGIQVNFVPANCEIEIDRRLLPGEDVDSVLGQYQRLIDSIAGPQGVDAIMHPPMLTDLPLETDANSGAVRTMVTVLQQLRLDARLIGVPFGSDASKFAALGIPSMILGPGNIDQAHAAVEYVECRQVIKAVEIYRNFMIQFE